MGPNLTLPLIQGIKILLPPFQILKFKINAKFLDFSPNKYNCYKLTKK